MKKTRIKEIISDLNELHNICKIEAEKNPINKDNFQSGKQTAYSHIYFEIKEIIDKANWLKSDRLFYKFAIPICALIVGIVIGMMIQ